MIHYQRSILIDAPVEAVWAFHERPDVLEQLTPPWQPVKIKRREGGLEVGAESEFLIFLGPLPIRWLARHVAYEKYRLFTDEQVKGPLRHWTHQHHFIPEGDKTRLTDAIAFSLPGGLLMNLLAGWIVQAQLESLFRYRHEVTQRECARTAFR